MKNMLAVEFLKLRRSKIVWIAVLAPLFLVSQGVANFVRYSGFWKAERVKWEIIYEQCVSFYGILLMPLLVTVLMALLARIEYGQNGWKQLLSLPVRRGQVYWTKFIVGLSLIILSTLILIAVMAIGGVLFIPGESMPLHLIAGGPLLSLVAILPIVALQFVLSMHFSHVGVPLTVGAGLAVPGALIANSKTYWIYYPWTYPGMALLGPVQERFDKGPLMYSISLLLFIIVMAVGAYGFKRRDIV
ncbi:ABC transporter permease [Aneurinibacillus tyrosinisolvens]|uniref:ABC transporter permease n=1 Tax=Aneurinibacillus tyrosinisolvens TaxID=1443435 RepID=UPI00063F5D48|nr:ABC transporter permease [Aneurinibacillus tyrosinisolvens]